MISLTLRALLLRQRLRIDRTAGQNPEQDKGERARFEKLEDHTDFRLPDRPQGIRELNKNPVKLVGWRNGLASEKNYEKIPLTHSIR